MPGETPTRFTYRPARPTVSLFGLCRYIFNACFRVAGRFRIFYRIYQYAISNLNLLFCERTIREMNDKYYFIILLCKNFRCLQKV